MTESLNFARPATLLGSTTKVRTAHGNLYITVNVLDGRPVEVFAVLGKAGSCDHAYMEAITRLISVSLQAGVPVKEIVEQLRSITCHPYAVGGEQENSGPIDAIGRVLESSGERTM